MERNTSRQLSVILPCLNEEGSIGSAILKIQNVFNRYNLNGEIIVVDNGSTDNSASIANQYSIKYIYESNRGYGNAYLAGISQAQGRYLIMVDPDNSYDVTEIPKFLKELEQVDFVIGSRYLGQIKKGAMPWSHKYIGNPIIRLMLRLNGLRIKETSTGFVGIRRESLDRLNLKSTGMEFSSELLVKANKYLRLKEIPITYNCRIGRSKLRNIPDGLRHINFLARSIIKQPLAHVGFKK